MKYNNTLIADTCCPFCHSSKGASLYTVTSSEAATHFVLPWQNSDRYHQLQTHLQKMWNQDTAQVIRCQTCEGVFAQPFQAGDKTFYDLAYERTGYPREKWEFDRAIAWFSANTQAAIANVNVLEIGAGEGNFIKKIMAAGGSVNTISAIEYSDWGRAQLKQLGLQDISYSSIPCNDLLTHWQERFDFIFMFQILEHLDNLDEKLKFLGSLLRPQGQIVIAVPNPKMIDFNEMHGALLDMPPNHVSRITQKAMLELADRNSFEVKLFEVEPLDRLSAYQEFCDYKYARRRQFNDSIAALISRLPKVGKIQRIFEKFYGSLIWFSNLPLLSQLETGQSQLIVIQKK
jgi:2-polyprenyl-3-methyl-5-hydroxy-6-metoxy-1,4-benzoquinol methylase